MSIQYYIQENLFNKKGKAYYAKTIINQKIEEHKLLAHIAKKGTALSIKELRAVLELFKQSIKELLAEGNMVRLKDFINLYPTITASFNSRTEFFNHNRDNVKIRCRISQSLMNDVKAKTTVERLSDEERQPNLHEVRSGINRENVIRWPYSTILRGTNLNPESRRLDSISIFSQEDPDQIIVFKANDLVLDTKGPKELSFSIANHVEIPSWLTPGLTVYLRTEYAGDNPRLKRESTEVKTFWQTVPETEEEGTEILETHETIN